MTKPATPLTTSPSPPERTTNRSRTTIDTSKLPERLKALRLPTLRETLAKLAEQAAREQWPHTQYLADLVDQECQCRNQSRIQRLVRQANLPPGKTWDQFQWSRMPLQVTQQFETLRAGDFLDRRDKVLIFGWPGSGKTMLVAALDDELVKRGRAVDFTTCQMLVQEFLRAKRYLRLERFIKKLCVLSASLRDLSCPNC